MSQPDKDTILQSVRRAYAQVALADSSGACCGTPSSCCGTAPGLAGSSLKLGYTEQELASVPAGADMGLGCGNPTAIAELRSGETVLDLGSGGGFDCLLAARAVGAEGRVIGVDMTPEMVSKASANAAQSGAGNMEFRLGEIECLPLEDACVDVIISNCVINLSPDKRRVFREGFRVLKPGGRLAVSDVVASCELPQEIRQDLTLHCACVSGASSREELRKLLWDAGFREIRIEPKDESRDFIREWAPGHGVEDLIVSASIRAVKPQSAA